MNKVADYTNSAGENFEILYEDAIIPHDADYWGYNFIVKHKEWGIRHFKAVILKTKIASKSKANTFLLSDPLDTMKALLNKTTKEGTPLFMFDISKGWDVI